MTEQETPIDTIRSNYVRKLLSIALVSVKEETRCVFARSINTARRTTQTQRNERATQTLRRTFERGGTSREPCAR